MKGQSTVQVQLCPWCSKDMYGDNKTLYRHKAKCHETEMRLNNMTRASQKRHVFYDPLPPSSYCTTCTLHVLKTLEEAHMRTIYHKNSLIERSNRYPFSFSSSSSSFSSISSSSSSSSSSLLLSKICGICRRVDGKLSFYTLFFFVIFI